MDNKFKRHQSSKITVEEQNQKELKNSSPLPLSNISSVLPPPQPQPQPQVTIKPPMDDINRATSAASDALTGSARSDMLSLSNDTNRSYSSSSMLSGKPQETDSSMSSISIPMIAHNKHQFHQDRPLYHHSTSFPLVSNNQSSHLFTLLPNPSSSTGSQVVGNVSPNNAFQQPIVQQPQPIVQQEQVPLTSNSDDSNSNSLQKVSTDETSTATSKVDEEEDLSRRRTLRYNWTDYEDRLLLKIILSNHATIHDLRHKPLKRFWELVADLIKNFSVNTKISRTHRQCRERFYVLYSKLVKFAEQLGIDPTALHRRLSQGLSFTELEELYLKILQVLRLEDGFKLVVNEDFYNDSRMVDELDRSVSLTKSKQKINDNDTTVSLISSKPDDNSTGDDKLIINNTSSNHQKITPLNLFGKSPTKKSKYSFSTNSYTNSSDNNTNRSQLQQAQERDNADDIMSSPPIMRSDNKSYSSISSGVSSSVVGAGVEETANNIFLKDKRRKSITIKDNAKTNVDDSSNSSLGSSSNSNEEEDERTPGDEDQLENSSRSEKISKPNTTGVKYFKSNDGHFKKSKSLSMTSEKPVTATGLELLSRRMDKIDTNIVDLQSAIDKLDNKMKDDLQNTFDKITKFQDGMSENINLIINELKNAKSKDDDFKKLSDQVNQLERQKISEDLQRIKDEHNKKE